MSDLVQRLMEDQEIETRPRSEPTLQAFKGSIDRGYIHAKFTQTRGGTELGIPIDRELSDLSRADFERGEGSVKIVGQLVLDYTKVRFHGTIDLATLKGVGCLEPLEDLG